MSKEHEAIARKYADSKQMFSIVLEGPAVGYIKGKKKTAGKSTSRGKYISHCIVFYETHQMQMEALETQLRKKDAHILDLKLGMDTRDSFQKDNEQFMLETRIQHLEKLLTENGIIY